MEERIFDNHKGLPTYESNEEAKKKYIQLASRFKANSCSRNDHLNALYEHLVGCSRFFWRVNKVVKVIAEDRIKEMQEEVMDKLTLINRVRALEDEVKGLEFNQGEVNNHSTSRRVKLITTQPIHLLCKKIRWIKS